MWKAVVCGVRREDQDQRRRGLHVEEHHTVVAEHRGGDLSDHGALGVRVAVAGESDEVAGVFDDVRVRYQCQRGDSTNMVIASMPIAVIVRAALSDWARNAGTR